MFIKIINGCSLLGTLLVPIPKGHDKLTAKFFSSFVFRNKKKKKGILLSNILMPHTLLEAHLDEYVL